MTIATLAQRAGAAGTRLLAWADRRLQERSTIAGIAAVLAAAGYSTLGAGLTSHIDLITMAAGALGSGLIAASTKPRPPELMLVTAVPHPLASIAPTDPAKVSPALPSMEPIMSILSTVRHILGIIAVAVAPTWNKAVANALAQAEAVLVPLIGDDAKKLCEDAASTTDGGFVKLEHVVADLFTIAADKGIKADSMVLTVIAAKAYAQVKADAPALIDTAIETGITVAAGPTVAALTAPIVEAGVSAALGAPATAIA